MTTLQFILAMLAVACVAYTVGHIADKPLPYLWCNTCDNMTDPDTGWCQTCRKRRPM